MRSAKWGEEEEQEKKLALQTTMNAEARLGLWARSGANEAANAIRTSANEPA